IETSKAEPARAAFLRTLFYDGKRMEERSVINFVKQHWSLDDVVSAQPIASSLDVDMPIRNSNKWHIRADKDFFFREGLRKSVTKLELAASKHRALWWLKRKFNFPTEAPIPPNPSIDNNRLQNKGFWGIYESEGGPIYELYPMIFGSSFNLRSDE